MRYDDLRDADCGVAQALGVVGDWWSWLILREVAGGVTRFGAIQQTLGISRRALTERLAQLVDSEVLRKSTYSDRPPRFDYLLTARGDGLLPVLVALQEFGDRHLLGDGSLTATATPASPEVLRVQGLLGRTVPDLTLAAHDGTPVPLRQGWRVVYLFPGAFAPELQGYPSTWGEIPGAAGCTLESTTYAARHPEFVRLGCEVVGVSTQRPDQQASFAAHVRLPFRLASDQDHRLAAGLRLPMFRAAGVDRFKRQTLLIDPRGVVRHVQMPVTDPAGSVDEMLTVVERLCGESTKND